MFLWICLQYLIIVTVEAKYEEALKHTDVVTAVTPDFILDSVKSKKLEDAKKYHPSLVIEPKPGL